MNMILGRSGALHKIANVCAAAEADDGKNVLLKVKDESLGAEIPYTFGVSKVFSLDQDGQLILPVKFRQDEKLRMALGLFYPRELAMTERKKTRLLDNGCKVGFLFGELEATANKADTSLKNELKTVMHGEAQSTEDEFWLKAADESIYVMVRVEGNIRRADEMIGFSLLGDRQIVGSEVVTYFVLRTDTLKNWPKEVPVAGECYADVDARYCAIRDELAEAVVVYQQMIDTEGGGRPVYAER